MRTAPLDDVHVGHDLDAADERLPHLRRQLDHVAERTVDPEAHAHAVFGRLDVHVGRAVAQCLCHDLVDDLHDRRVQIYDLVDRARRQLHDQVAGPEGIDVGADGRQRAVGLVDAVAQLRGHAERDVHFFHRQRPEEAQHVGVQGVGDGDRERAVGDDQRQHVE